MNSINPENGLNNNNLQLLDRSENLMNDHQDLENIFSLIRVDSTDLSSVLEKIKSIAFILLHNENFELLKKKCLQKSNGGKKVKIGSAVFHDYRIISISVESFNSSRNNIIAKFLPRNGYLNNIPGTIKNFSLKKARLRLDCWENIAEISILGNFGKEYYMKINFFTYN